MSNVIKYGTPSHVFALVQHAARVEAEKALKGHRVGAIVARTTQGTVAVGTAVGHLAALPFTGARDWIRSDYMDKASHWLTFRKAAALTPLVAGVFGCLAGSFFAV